MATADEHGAADGRSAADEHSARLQAVAERALDERDLEATELKLVSASENTVFHVATEGERAYALRVHRPGYHTLAELNSERQWTAALNGSGLRAPQPLLTRDGRSYATVAFPDSNETRHVGIVEWIDGVPLARIIEQATDEETVAQHFVQLGRIAARIHNQAMDWRLPTDFQRHAFDADGLMGEAPFWGPFWDLPQLQSAQRKQILAARRAIHEALTDYGKERGTYSLIHADLHPHNLLVDGEDLHVIDFDDAGFGWHQYELAVALFSYQGEARFDTIRDALIAGYRSERAIDDEALELLPMFLLIRALVLLGWIHHRPELDRSKVLPRLIAAACALTEELHL